MLFTGSIHSSHKGSSVFPAASVKKSPVHYSRSLYKTARTNTAMAQPAFNTSEEKPKGLSAHSKPLKTGASRTPKTVQCHVSGFSFPDTTIRNSRKVFRDFAERIVQWKILAQFLKVSDVQTIDEMYEFQNEKCFQMLCSWQKQSGNAATYMKLAEGFKHVEQEHLIEKLYDHIQSSVAEATEIDID